MPDVKFGNESAYEKWGIVLQPVTIALPEPRTERIEVPGRNGTLDLMDAMGEVTYGDRQISLEFYKLDTTHAWAALVSNVANTLHGKKMKLTFDSDEDYYYYGRIAVGDFQVDGNVGMLNMEVVAEPFKYKQEVTTVTASVTDSKVITLANERMTVCPKITVAGGDITIVWDNRSETLSPGEHQILGLTLPMGDTTLNLTGTGTITFAYQEGAL